MLCVWAMGVHRGKGGKIVSIFYFLNMFTLVYMDVKKILKNTKRPHGFKCSFSQYKTVELTT